MKRFVLVLHWIGSLAGTATAQTVADWNLNVDLELTRAGDLSHYFYNEIHRTQTNWRVDLTRSDFLLGVKIGKHWKVQSQITIDRNSGQRFGLFRKPSEYDVRPTQMNLQWTSADQLQSVTFGQILTPFGRFYEKQFYWQRSQIMTPLAYSYHVSIAEKIGFVPGLGKSVMLKDGDAPVWGTPLLYHYGYNMGIAWRKRWKNQMATTLSLLSSSPNLQRPSFDPVHAGVVGRLQYPVRHDLELGLSASVGTFLQNSTFSQKLTNLNRWTQTLVGLDYEWGRGFFTLSGELFWARYHLPGWDAQANDYFSDGNSVRAFSLHALSHYVDCKIEPPFLSGSYVTFRTDLLTFGQYTDRASQQSDWSDGVWRNSLTIGYKINAWLTSAASFSSQRTENRPWNNRQNIFRCMISCHL